MDVATPEGQQEQLAGNGQLWLIQKRNTASSCKLNRGVFPNREQYKRRNHSSQLSWVPGAGRMPPANWRTLRHLARCAHTAPSCISGTPLAVLTPAAFSGNPHRFAVPNLCVPH